jgi:alpha-beta hydrolase superfamily lysophospholipase
LKNLNGIIVFLNGLNDYSNRNAHIARKFSEKGFDVAAFDYCG